MSEQQRPSDGSPGRDPGLTEQQRGSAGDPARDLMDDALAKGISALPEGKPRTFLVQAGWVGLVLGVLIGNIPVTALVTAAAKGQGTLTTDSVEAYFIVFVIVTPWVVAFAAIAFAIAMDIKMHPYAAAFGGALLIAGAGWLSYQLGGAVPLEVVQGPTHGTPVGAAEYAIRSLGSYITLYGPWPPLAGLIEGSFFGYWASVLAKD